MQENKLREIVIEELGSFVKNGNAEMISALTDLLRALDRNPGYCYPYIPHISYVEIQSIPEPEYQPITWCTAGGPNFEGLNISG